tara:strand:- start:13236 stop:13370 length:135 start_codon:yes stop_codon:yes gene_type:complete
MFLFADLHKTLTLFADAEDLVRRPGVFNNTEFTDYTQFHRQSRN